MYISSHLFSLESSLYYNIKKIYGSFLNSRLRGGNEKE